MIKRLFIVLLICGALTSCGESQKDIDAAKQDLLGNKQTTQEEQKTPENTAVVIEQDEKELIQIISLDNNNFLEFDELLLSSLRTGEVIITGTTNITVDKIQILFTNPTSQYPDDDYTLKAFEAGDTEFKYIASSKNQVLDFGQNEYIFKAYSGKEVSQTKIILEVPNEDEKETTGKESNLIGTEGNTILIDLPTSSKYGEPMKLGEASFTYTQIKGLEIQKQILEPVTCEGLTEYLSGQINTWYYWNTCRDIVKEKGIKFNVVRLNGENYIYERHYIDFTHGFYGVYELETGEGVTSENIADKNSELKGREFPSLEIVDDLIKDIVNT